MAAILQLRRSTTNASPSLTEGELFLHNGVGSIQFGSGSVPVAYTLLPLNAPVAGNINLIGNITASNATLSGDIRIGGNIYLGDTLANDNINVNAQFSGSMIPQTNNVFDLGSNSSKWRNIYVGGNIAVDGTIDGVDISSQDTLYATKFTTLGTYTGSVDTKFITLSYSTSSLNSYTSSQDTKNLTLSFVTASYNSATASLNTFSASVLGHITDINTKTGSFETKFSTLATYTGSLEDKNSTLANTTGSLISSASNIALSSSNIDSKFTTLGTYTSSIEADLARIHESTSSLNSYTSSQDTKNTTLGTYTGSIDTKWDTLSNVTASILSYTQSLKDAITVTGTDASSTTTIKGSLVVQGVTTAVNSTTIQMGDNIIELNGMGVLNAGIIVKDPTGANTESGSLLYNTTNDYWMAGTWGNESKILLAGGMDVVSGSAQIKSLLPNGTVSGSSQVTSSLDFRYLEINGDNVVSSSAQVLDILTSLNAATSSYETKGRGIVSGSSQVIELLPTGTVSGSSQITYVNISSIPSGIVSGSSQVTPLLPIGTISGSSQVVYTSLSSIPAGIVSSSSQIQSSLPNGVVSGSSQLTSSYDDRYASSGSLRDLIGAHQTSGSLRTGAWYDVSSSIADGNPNTLGNAFAIKTYVDAAMVLAGAGDITAVNAGNGLSGGALSGSATLTLDTGSTHFTNGVDARLIPLTSLNSYTSSQDTKNSTLSTYTASLDSKFSTLATYTASVDTLNTAQNNRLTSLETFTGSVPSLTSLNSYTSSQDTKNTTLGTYTSSLDTKNSTLSTYTASLDTKNSTLSTYTASLDTKNTTLGTYTASLDTKNTTLGTYTASLDTKNTTLASVTASLLSSQTNLNSYTSSLNAAIQLTGSTVSFLGDIVVYGTQSVINSQNVQISDNILYLSPTASTDNDLGVVGHYNDGTYRHAGIFMDASDGHSWKVFNGLTDETLGTVNTSGTGFTLADFKAGAITGTSIWGAISASNGVVSGSSQITKTLQNVTTAGATTSDVITFTNATSTVSTGTGALVITGGVGIGGGINAGGDIVAYSSSDIRLKNNIKPIENAVEKINKIGGYTFDWNKDLQDIYSGKDYGVIAQEIEEMFPELVQTRENGYKAVKYDKLVSVLIAGIQELSKEITDLKNKIKE